MDIMLWHLFTVGIIAQIITSCQRKWSAVTINSALFAFGAMFVYLWAGGHHLIYSACGWMQTGFGFSGIDFTF